MKETMIYKPKHIWIVRDLSYEFRNISHLENNLVEKEKKMFVNDFSKLLSQIIQKHIKKHSTKPHPFYFQERLMK